MQNGYLHRRRLLLIIPTLCGIMVINFAIVQFAPGGPVEQLIAQITGSDVGATARISGGSGTETGASSNAASTSGIGSTGVNSKYRGRRVLIEICKTARETIWFRQANSRAIFKMMGNYLMFDFGTSYFRDETVINRFLKRCLYLFH